MVGQEFGEISDVAILQSLVAILQKQENRPFR
jgi:hypothetical protein